MIPIGDHVLRLGWNSPAVKMPKAQREQQFRDVVAECQPLTGPLDIADGTIRAASAAANWTGPAVRDSVVLVGDALQTSTPFGGQGMSFALRQVGWLLDAADAGMERRRLVDYERDSRFEHRHLGVLNTGIYHHFYSTNPTIQRLGRPIRDVWATDPSRSNRLGELFGGTWSKPLSALELMNLLAVPVVTGVAGRVRHLLGAPRA